MLTTLCFGRFASPLASRMFPGAPARFRLEVIAQTTTVPMRLRLKRSFWMTTWGWRYPGPEPEGRPRSTQNTSPCAITTDRGPAGDAGEASRAEAFFQRRREDLRRRR